MKTPHVQAYTYTRTFTDHQGILCKSHYVIALCAGVNIFDLVQKWQQQSRDNNFYTLGEEIDLNKALDTASISGMTIRKNWTMLDQLSHHSVCTAIEEI